MATATFVGACGTVTGSCTLLQFGDRRILVDCGHVPGWRRARGRVTGNPFPFDPIGARRRRGHARASRPCRPAAQAREGRLHGNPSGARGRPGRSRGWCSRTPPSSRKRRRATRSARATAVTPSPRRSSNTRDARRGAATASSRIPFHEEQELFPGHPRPLPPRRVTCWAPDRRDLGQGRDGERRNWCFSGDVGRYEVPILVDPSRRREPADALLLESTYGDRRHEPGDPRRRLGQIVRRTFDARRHVADSRLRARPHPGRPLPPLAARRPRLLAAERIFLDSPMAIRATEIYQPGDRRIRRGAARARQPRQGPARRQPLLALPHGRGVQGAERPAGARR